MKGRLVAILAFFLAGASPVHAGVIEFTDKNDWIAAVQQFTTIGFTGFPDHTFITDQYEELGVLFTDGNDNIACCSFITFPIDGSGLTRTGSRTNRAGVSQPVRLTWTTPSARWSKPWSKPVSGRIR